MKKRTLHCAASVFLALCLLIQLVPAASALVNQTTFVGVDTMMIYNPAASSSTTRYTGSLLGQISTAAGSFHNSAGSDDQEDYYSLDINELYAELEGRDLTGVAGEQYDVPGNYTGNYTVGSQEDFFVQPEESYKYQYGTFTCLYSGTHCRVWGLVYDDSATAAAMGKAFDETIFPGDTEAFGTARYIKDGDKLNILVYPMYSTGLCGFFRPIELLTAAELGSDSSDSNSKYYNHDAAVIHINSFHCSPSRYESTGLVTLAHEYQHLICMSSTLLGNGHDQLKMMSTALNEAMAAAAEEWIYPGEMTELGYVSRNYNGSGLIASGQSLYNFTTTSGDIGVYGQALLYSEYLKQQAGTGVFHAIHDYWRNAPAASLTDADALYSVFHASVRQDIDAHVTYSSSIKDLFNDEESEFLSKMNLAYQIATVLQEPSGIYSTTATCSDANPKLYTGSGCYIEGGGRLLVATADGNTFTVPAGASSQLIYVGFRDGEMVIPPTTAADYDPSSPYTVTAVSSNESYGTVSVNDVVITATPAAGCSYGIPAATVLSGEATVVRSGNTFTVSPSTDCTVQINFAPAASSAPDVWDGSVKDPIFSEGAYYITSAAELAGLAQLVNSGNNLANTDVYLERNLDLNHLAWTPIGYHPTSDTALNDYSLSVPFSGRFYGQGHVISGLAIGTPDAPYSETDSAGLFGCVANPDKSHDAVISGLIVKNAAVYGKDRVGILIGYAWGAKVSDCEVSGSVSAVNIAGGLAGNFGYGSSAMGTRSITRCFSSADVTATSSNAGGFVGYASSVDISLCGATGDVEAWIDNAGGFVGTDFYSSSAGSVGYENCYATGDVKAGSDYVGGFVGYANSTRAVYCYAAGAATGSSTLGMVGGFAGSYSAYLDYSYCDGEKTLFPIGGTYSADTKITMLQTSAMKVQSSYDYLNFDTIWTISPYANDGYPVLRWQVNQALSIQITAPKGYLSPGETLQLTVTLEPSETVGQSYVLESSDSEIASVSPTGLVTAHRPGQVILTARAVKGSAVGTFPLLVLSEDTIAGGFGGGSGTAEDPYLISSTAHLEHLATLVNYGVDFAGKELLQIGDLTFHCTAEDPWIPIGTENAPFRGSYNGNRYTISGLFVSGTDMDPVGLFGVAEGATIACIDLADSTFSGGTVGAIAGRVSHCGVVDCCTAEDVSVSVTAEQGIGGGIIGLVADPGDSTLSQIGFCANAASVSCSLYHGEIGGIIGRSNDSGAQVVACRNSAAISCSPSSVTRMNAGGLVGSSTGGYILQCANTGNVSGSRQGYAGGLLGIDYGKSTIMNCYATGTVSAPTDYTGGLVGFLASDGRLANSYFGGTIPMSGAYFYGGLAGWLGSTSSVSYCYYPSGLYSPHKFPWNAELTAAQMKDASSFEGWDFDGVWTFVEGENNGYPVLRNFHPLWDGNAPVFDRAPFSEGCKDVTVVFDTQGNVFESVQGLTEGQYITGAYDSETNRQEVTISRDYLMTLGVLEDADGIKNHTFTANFGAGCTVDFEIQVVDHTPDEYLYAVEGFTPSNAGTPGSVELILSAPRNGYVVCAAAIYNPDHSLKDLTSTRTMLSQGGNTLTLELDFAEGETCSLFLLDGESLAPLSESKTVLLSSTQGRLQDTDLGTVEGLLARMDRITAYAQ